MHREEAAGHWHWHLEPSGILAQIDRRPPNAAVGAVGHTQRYADVNLLAEVQVLPDIVGILVVVPAVVVHIEQGRFVGLVDNKIAVAAGGD